MPVETYNGIKAVRGLVTVGLIVAALLYWKLSKRCN